MLNLNLNRYGRDLLIRHQQLDHSYMMSLMAMMIIMAATMMTTAQIDRAATCLFKYFVCRPSFWTISLSGIFATSPRRKTASDDDNGNDDDDDGQNG